MTKKDIEILREIYQVISWNTERMSSSYSQYSLEQLLTKLNKIIITIEEKNNL